MFCGLPKGKEQRMFGVNHQKKPLTEKSSTQFFIRIFSGTNFLRAGSLPNNNLQRIFSLWLAWFGKF